ncbi:MAG TPA: FAD-linked oxidase C-terminal domain-containing protein [Chloroflexota bacterium]|nr:FAD-linked oxidase C-terminal domain-containing protein [Chloroflexota bacterium]
MLRSDLLAELGHIVGVDNIFYSRRDRLSYEYDGTAVTSQPDVVLFPRDSHDTSAIMRVARREGIPVVPRGAGTNLSGGTVPLEGGIVVCFTRMNRILHFDTGDERAVVEPGVVNLDLEGAVAPFGYLYAPDPSSQKVSTMGGNIAENAGGPHCLKYGVTTNHVYGLEVVLPDGQIVQTGGAVEDCPGYDLTGLIVGAEGTLGMVTSITVRLLRQPEAIRTMLAIFDDLDSCGDAVSDIIAQGIIPATLELMDSTTVGAIEDSGKAAGYPRDADGILLIELDGMRDGQDRQIQQIREICRAHNAREVQVAKTDADRDRLWSGRRAAYSALVALDSGSSIHDTTVPRTNMTEALHRIREIGNRHRVRVSETGHAGDGNLHPLIVYNLADPDEVERVRRADHEIVELCVEMGGSPTGEHGIGREKIAYMSAVYSEVDLELMRMAKRAIDPNGLLNPGKLIPPASPRS